MKRNKLALVVVLIELCCGFVTSYEVCYRRDVLGHEGYITCKDSCCGSLHDKYCCRKTEIAIIVGSVIGVVVLFAVVIAIISCLCCHRHKLRRGYSKVPEGPECYGSTTHYDIPRTPSGPNISVQETFAEGPDCETERTRRKEVDSHKDRENVVVDVDIAVDHKEDSETRSDFQETIKVETEGDDQGEVEMVQDNGEELIINDDVDISRHEIDRIITPTIIVTDTDTPSGRHSYVEIKSENTLSENCMLDSAKQQTNDNEHLMYIDEEVSSACSPLLQDDDQYTKEADVDAYKNSSNTILITDLDADITEEISDLAVSGELGESDLLPDLTVSHEGSIVSDLTVSHGESTESDLTITQEGSFISGESLLPDLVISEAESVSSKSSRKEEIRMGNKNQTDEKVYVYDKPPADAYVTCGPTHVEAYVEDALRTALTVAERNKPVIAYSEDSRPNDPGPAGAYAYPDPAADTCMTTNNQPYDPNPMEAYSQSQPVDAYNPPMEAYQDNQQYRNERPMEAYQDNQPYESDTGFQNTDLFTSDPVEAYVSSDNQPSDAY